MLTATTPPDKNDLSPTRKNRAVPLENLRPRRTLSKEAIDYFSNISLGDRWRKQTNSYLKNTIGFLTKVISPGKKVLVVGCLTTDVLEALKPSLGVCLDASDYSVREARAKNRNSQLSYYSTLPENFSSAQTFDYVVVLNYVDHSQDILALVDSLQKFTHRESKFIFSMINPLWHRLVQFASKLSIRVPDYQRNLVASHTLTEALEIKRTKVTSISRRILVPKTIPFVSRFANQVLARLPVLNRLCFLHYITARPLESEGANRSTCTVLIPCFNEEGNIEECIRRVPKLGSYTEILVVNDGSKDRTAEIVTELSREFSNLRLITYQKNEGKGSAVTRGIRGATGDIVMILDADMTVPPEELVDFYDAVDSQAADFASGTRFVYPMEQEAMRLSNFFGNQLFSGLIQFIVGTRCSDTLCGTKAMWRRDFENFVLEDPKWGDFDLIFHAAKLKLKCIEVPVHYRSRTAGESKMRAFSAGISFLKLCLKKWWELP